MTKFGFTFALALALSFASRAQNTPPVADPAPVTEPKPAAPEAPPTAAPAKEKKKTAKPAKKKAAAAKPAPAEKPATEKAEEPASFTPIGTATVKDATVNVRGRASFTGEVVAKLHKGDTVTILEEITLKNPKQDEPKNWFRISLPANTPVWAFADFVDQDAKTVKPNKLNLRSGPGENFSVLGRMQKGDAVKIVNKKEDWVQLEAPANCYAFVAAETLEKQTEAPKPAPAPVIAEKPEPTPAPAPEVTTLPPAETPKPAEVAPVEAPKPAEPLPLPPPQIAISTPAETAPAVLPKRIVKREGIVHHVGSIQAPTYFQLEHVDSHRVINYLHSPEEVTERVVGKKNKKVIERKPKFDIKPLVNKRVIVTGEEFTDKRWKDTPVIEIESIEPAP